jgi:hypothetical protein
MGGHSNDADQIATCSRLLGGCQYGRLRCSAGRPFAMACLCHCRMCQKATGSPFSAYVQGSELTWTRSDAPRCLSSSEYAAKGFCPDCGTPLSYEPHIDLAAVSIAAFDSPDASALPPPKQFTRRAALAGSGAYQSWSGVAQDARSNHASILIATLKA